MSDCKKDVVIVDKTSNPAPLGLAGFGLTTMLLNLHNAGLFELNSMILAMGVFFGGMAQVWVGKKEWEKNNMFGMLAFSSYGYFWLILVALIVAPQLEFVGGSSKPAMGWFLLLWGIFSFGLWVCTWKMAKIMNILFLTVVLLFFGLAIGDFTGNKMITQVTGIEGVICGGIALYISLATVINEVHGKMVLPIK